jgi:hypothetical protein
VAVRVLHDAQSGACELHDARVKCMLHRAMIDAHRTH